MKYVIIRNGERRPLLWTKREMCCDCGLVHIYKIRRGKDKFLYVRTFRDNRATAAARRGNRYKGLKLPK